MSPWIDPFHDDPLDFESDDMLGYPRDDDDDFDFTFEDGWGDLPWCPCCRRVDDTVKRRPVSRTHEEKEYLYSCEMCFEFMWIFSEANNE